MAKKKFQLAAEQDLDEAVRSQSSDLTSGSPCPEDTSPTASMCSCEDATKADLSSDPKELVDHVEHEDGTVQETINTSSTSSFTSSTQPAEHHEVRSVVMDENLVTDMGLTKGLSGQDGHIEPSQIHLAAEQHVESVIGSVT